MVLVHGFTQSAGAWEPLAASLAADFETVAVDAPGHGGSGVVRAADLAETAALVAETAGRGVFVGYSMGGRICLQLALERPSAARAVVLVSATAGIEDAAERADRRRSDHELADRLDPPPADALEPGSADAAQPLALEEFLAEWLAGPLFAGLGPESRAIEARLANTGTGLASSLRSAGTGSMSPLWGRLRELQMPVAIVVGADDPKFTVLGRRLAEGIGAAARLEVVPGAGHSVPFERPAEFEALLRRFLRGLPAD